MFRKILILLLLFTFVFCGSSESNDVVELFEPQETSTANSSTSTTAAKAEDTTTTSTTSTTTSSTTSTSTTVASPTTSTTVNAEDIALPTVTVTNCPTTEVNVETYELSYEITAGDYDVDYLRISYWKNDDYYSRVYFDKTMQGETFPFPTALETKVYSQKITDDEKDAIIKYDVYFSISDESDAFFEIETVCTFSFNNVGSNSTGEGVGLGYPKLEIKEVSTSIPTYDRDDWSHWSDDDGDCQNIRHEVLQDETQEAVIFTTSSNCYVATGKWYGVYTGEYYYSASELHVDHFVPLKNAHDSGGYEWSLEKKKEYANYLEDPDHLIAVQSGANRSKGARGPEDWKPVNTEYWCQYAYDWIRIKHTWGLTATQAEWDALKFMIATCPYGYSYEDAIPEPLVTVPTTTTSTTTSTTTTTVPSTTTTIPDNPGDTKNCSDFETYQEAKTWFDTYFPYYGDVAGLDGDGDEEPCESLPGSP